MNLRRYDYSTYISFECRKFGRIFNTCNFLIGLSVNWFRMAIHYQTQVVLISKNKTLQIIWSITVLSLPWEYRFHPHSREVSNVFLHYEKQHIASVPFPPWLCGYCWREKVGFVWNINLKKLHIRDAHHVFFLPPLSVDEQCICFSLLVTGYWAWPRVRTSL